MIGSLGTLAGFAVLVYGMYASLQMPQQTEQYIIPWVALGMGIILLNVGKYHSMRYGSRPRIDQALAQALKGQDQRSHLYNFIPGLPVEHLLITPTALVILAPRPFFGDVIHEGHRWSRPWTVSGLLQRFSDLGIGNPTAETQRDTEAVQKLLRERLGDNVGGSISVVPIIVMTNPRIRLQMTNPEIPVVKLADLRGAIRKLRDGTKMPAEIQRQLSRALLGELSAPSNPKELSTTRSSSWQRTQKTSNR